MPCHKLSAFTVNIFFSPTMCDHIKLYGTCDMLKYELNISSSKQNRPLQYFLWIYLQKTTLLGAFNYWNKISHYGEMFWVMKKKKERFIAVSIVTVCLYDIMPCSEKIDRFFSLYVSKLKLSMVLRRQPFVINILWYLPDNDLLT